MALLSPAKLGAKHSQQRARNSATETVSCVPPSFRPASAQTDAHLRM